MTSLALSTRAVIPPRLNSPGRGAPPDWPGFCRGGPACHFSLPRQLGKAGGECIQNVNRISFGARQGFRTIRLGKGVFKHCRFLGWSSHAPEHEREDIPSEQKPFAGAQNE